MRTTKALNYFRLQRLSMFPFGTKNKSKIDAIFHRYSKEGTHEASAERLNEYMVNYSKKMRVLQGKSWELRRNPDGFINTRLVEKTIHAI